jgi:predicted transcriptional regulator
MKAAIDTIARADYRSTSSLIELALAQFIERETTKRGAGH